MTKRIGAALAAFGLDADNDRIACEKR